MSFPHAKKLAIVIILTVGALWGFGFSGDKQGAPALPGELTVEGIKAKQPGDMRRAMRETMERDDLTDAQREQVHRNFRTVRLEQMTERMEEYFAASEEERQAVLDRHIDEQMKMRKRRDADRRTREAHGGRDSENGVARRDRPGSRRPRTQQERKQRSESRDPDERARQMAYRSAMRERMLERGIDPPQRGPGRGR